MLDLTKLKGLPDDKINVTKKFKFVLGRIENIVRDRENANYLFPPIFFFQSFNAHYNLELCGKKLTCLQGMHLINLYQFQIHCLELHFFGKA